MDILNFISWTKEGNVIATVSSPEKTLIPVGLYDPRRGDNYLPAAISVADLLNATPVLPALIKYDEANSTLWNNGADEFPTNLSYGEFALSSNAGGINNTAIGFSALENNSSGYSNTAIGQNALKTNTTGNRNTAIGVQSLTLNTTGINNIAVGYETLFYNISGRFLSASGVYALRSNTTGMNSTAYGYNALSTSTTASSNTAVGNAALSSTTVGGFNTAVGHDAASTNTTGVDNTVIGALTSVASFNGCVVLGKNAAANGSNQFVVGSSATNAGAITTEALTPTISWAVRINGVNYKIPLQIA